MKLERQPVGPFEDIQVFKRNHPLFRFAIRSLIRPLSSVFCHCSPTQSFGSWLEPRYIFGAETLI